MKKYIALITILLTLTQQAIAQFNENPIVNKENIDKSRLNYGYFLGFNKYGFKFDYNENTTSTVTVTESIGFNVGLIGELRLNDHFDIRIEPGLFYTQRGLHFSGPGIIDKKDELRDVKSTYIKFPLLLKVSTLRIGNWKPYVIGGASFSLNLASNEQNIDDNITGANFRMKKNTFYYELGFGIDFYLPYFKFSPSIRGVFAITDEIVPDNTANSPWTGNINSMKTRGIFINFTFE